MVISSDITTAEFSIGSKVRCPWAFAYSSAVEPLKPLITVFSVPNVREYPLISQSLLNTVIVFISSESKASSPMTATFFGNNMFSVIVPKKAVRPISVTDAGIANDVFAAGQRIIFVISLSQRTPSTAV